MSAAGIDEVKSASVSIGPNPCSRWLHISHPEGRETDIFINDLTGRKVREQRVNSDPVDLADLPPGTYLLHVSDGNSVTRFKLIRQ